MLPPPAPIALTSTIGTRTGKPSMRPSERTRGSPSLTSAMSQLVPPMSTLMRFLVPTALPTAQPPITPAAGPLRNNRTGRLAAVLVALNPPRDCMICKGAGTPRLRSSSVRLAR